MPVELTEIPARGFVFDALVDGPEEGVGVILLHGFPQTSSCWRQILPTLAGAGYRVVAPDQRGYSPRARPIDLAAYERSELLADVLALADHFGFERFHLVGHDWGAVIAWHLASRFPDRLLTVTALSVPHPAAFARAMADGDGDQARRSGYMEIFRAAGAEREMVADGAVGLRMIYLGAGLSEDEAAPYLDVMGTAGALGAALNWYRTMDPTGADGMGPITTPSLFIWSTDDPAIGRVAAEGTVDFVDGPYQFEVLEGISHWIPDHAADETAQILIDHFA